MRRNSRPAARRRFRPLLEALEHRLALAVITVNTTAQEVNSNGSCSLQEAIFSANFDRSLAIDPSATDLHSFIPTACTAGSGNDTIVLQEGAVYSMNSVVNDPLNQLGPSATPVIFSQITINANGATLQHTGDKNMRLFSIADLYTGINVDGHGISAGTAGDVSLRNAYIKDFQTHGGNGASGGGGGLGAGGAILVKNSVLYVIESTFEGNSATGGNGGLGQGGGGGGLGGRGGSSGIGITTGGGGGGGARGEGGDSLPDRIIDRPDVPFGSAAGGGGGGTLGDGVTSTTLDPATANAGGPGGFNCGGHGGGFNIPSDDDGEDGRCQGGGGGGGPPGIRLDVFTGGDGGDGNYGGGGGGGGFLQDGGDGGFGGGGGAGGGQGDGGDGGFGGGGGAGDEDGEGNGGGGDASPDNGGGGAAYGGAIFNHNGSVSILNSTFTGNSVKGGDGGHLVGTPANSGIEYGGAIYSVGGSLAVLNSTVSGNQSSAHDNYIGGIGVVDSAFALFNTIVANNGPRECAVSSNNVSGAGNLIGANYTCPGVVLTGDPLLQPLSANALGQTPTLALPINSPAIDAGVNAASLGIIGDQRGAFRPQGAGYDIGAYEFGLPDLRVSIFALPDHVDAGFDLTYTMRVVTDNDAPSARLLAPIPAHTTFAAIDGPADWTCAYDPFTGASGSAVCTTPLLPSGSVDQFHLTVHVAANTPVNATIAAAAIVSTTLPDSNVANNNYFDSTTALAYDYGDAPDSYQTLRVNAGARHVGAGPTLGSLRDLETNADGFLKGIGDDLPGLEIGSSSIDDEDGVVLPALTTGLSASVQVTASAAAQLDAFIDWNDDGDFGDAGEKVFNSVSVAAGVNTLTIAVPSGAVPGNTFARFRLSMAGGLSFNGTASDGEVEDYPVTITSFDFGDAPDSYHTFLASNGPRHVAAGPTLGGLRDMESNASALLKGFGDDQVGLEIGSTDIDDEDGVTLTPLTTGETATVLVTASAGSQLDAFIDWNRDGDFADAGEQVFASLAVMAGVNTLTLAVPPGASPGTTYARFRLSTAGGHSYDGLALDGEVEDYSALVQSNDFGDAPNSYQTSRASGGARHVATGLLLGTARDGEPDAAAPLSGTGDDTTSSDDEDGVRLPTQLIPRLGARIVVSASAAGKLDAWIDYNRNGTFDAAEQIATSLPVLAGDKVLSIVVPESATAGTTYARFRLSSAGGLGPTGPAADGEVEDYAIQIFVPAARSAAIVDDPENPGQSLLLVNGTSANDTITVQAVPLPNWQIRVKVNANSFGPFNFAALGRIAVFGNAGNDTITVSPLIAIPAVLYGGIGNDTLKGGSGFDALRGEAGNDKLDGGAGDDLLEGGVGDDSLMGAGGRDKLLGGDGKDKLEGGAGDDLLQGGAGDDTLKGGSGQDTLVGEGGKDNLDGGGGRNVLIGGAGRDTLLGNSDSDLLIAGSTIYDANAIALRDILLEWTSTRSYTDRVANLRSGSGPILTVPETKLKKGLTVIDDADVDVLIGTGDNDWFLFDTGRDIASDRRSSEAVN